MTRRARFLAVALAALALGPRTASACDSASCVIVTRGQEGVAKGAFAVNLSFRYTSDSKRLAGSSTTDTVVIPRIDFEGERILPGFHNERTGEANSLQADLGYGITSRLSLQASLPLFNRKAYSHSHVPVTVPPPTDPVPGEPLPDDGHGGHGGPTAALPVDREYRTDGFGDTLVGVGYSVWGRGTQRLSAAAALKLPTGASEIPNTYDGGLHDPMLQPGTGSLDYVVAAAYVHGGAPLAWAATASQQFTTENDLHYEFGNETILGLGLTRTLRAVYSRSMVSASVQVKAHFRGRSTYLGGPVPSTGGRMVILSPGLRVTTPGGMGFYAYVQLPLYRYVNDAQLSTRAALLTGVSKAF
jgi:hypothetical protein